MVRIKIDANMLRIMGLFERVTRSKLKDCFTDEITGNWVFVVLPGEIRKAIGKGAVNVRKLEDLLKKKIKIVEFAPEKLQFIKNMLYPNKVKEIHEEDDGTILMEAKDHKTRGYIIGRNAQNLRNLEKQLRRYFEVKELKVQ